MKAKGIRKPNIEVAKSDSLYLNESLIYVPMSFVNHFQPDFWEFEKHIFIVKETGHVSSELL